MDSITREDVAGFQILLQGQRMAAATIRGYMGTLRTFLLWCHQRGYAIENVAGDLLLTSRQRKEVEWLEEHRAKELRRGVTGHPLEGPVCAILWLGLRRAEMFNLEWRDVNYESEMVRVRGTKTPNAFREVCLPPKLAKYLRSLKQSEVFPNVLLNTAGEPWNKDSLNSSIRRFRATCSIPFHWNFRILRATYGSLLVQQGIPIAHVSLALGHADVRVTQDWYIGLSSTHVSPQISEAITRALG